MRIRYNAPFVVSMTLTAAVVLFIDNVAGYGIISLFFLVPPTLDYLNPFNLFRLFSYPLGHASWMHFMGNFMFIVPIGQLVEERYGSKRLMMMAASTAAVTGVLNAFLFPTGLLGASGIVFMLIVLSSFSNFRKGEIPITFIFIILLFFVKEFINAFSPDNVSQFGHFIGGICGGIFGFTSKGRVQNEKWPEQKF